MAGTVAGSSRSTDSHPRIRSVSVSVGLVSARICQKMKATRETGTSANIPHDHLTAREPDIPSVHSFERAITIVHHPSRW